MAQTDPRPRATRVAAHGAIALLVALGGMQVAARPAAAALVVDQVQDVAQDMLCIIRTEGARCHNGQAQRVTVGADGDLVAVDLLLSRGAQSTGSLTIEVHANEPNGTLLATSDAVPADEIPIGSYDEITEVDWVTFEFPVAPTVSTGDEIVIVLPPTPLDDSAWGWVTGGNSYLGGYSYESEPGGFWEGGGDDLAFVTYLGVGPSPFVDTVDSSFFWDIEWLFESGITSGCTAYTFCPTKEVTRGQMAAFLDRALALPDTSSDFFTDDESSSFEANINRLAAAGITKGCTATKFCPTATVTRGQMAAFLDRVLALPITTTDFFTDDETSSFENAINRLAVSGITKGCTATKFCPTATVTRGQMAAFLRRAVTD